MRSLVNIIDRILKPALAILMAMMVLCVTWQVLSRYLLQSPSSWTEELARFLLVWIGMLGASYAYRTKMHLGLDLLTQKVSGNQARILRLFTLAIAASFAVAVMIIGGGSLVALTWELEQLSAALGVRIAYVYTVIPISGLFICIYAIDEAINASDPPVEQT